MLRIALIFVLITLLGRAFWQFVDGLVEGATGGRLPQRRGRPAGDQSIQMARDPVCGTFVVRERAVVVADGTRRVYFCSTACRDRYRAKSA